MNSHIKNTLRITAIASAGMLLWGGAADAQAPAAVLTVNKQVEGDFPTTAVFVVHVVCDFSDEQLDFETDLEFDYTGAPIDDNVLELGNHFGLCTVKETDTEGAEEVAYSCTDNANALDNEKQNGVSCEGIQGDGSYEVDYDSASEVGLVTVVTVTNESGEMPPTGGSPTGLLVAGLAALGAGLGLLGAATRRRFAR